MSVVRIVTERLFLLLFWIARSAFLAQGLAMCAALMATSMASREDAPAWLQIALRSSLVIGATLFVTGVLLVMARRLPPPGEGDDTQSSSAWPGLLGLSLVALPAVAYAAASELFPLWRELLQLLDDIGFWAGLQQPGPSGLVILPILAALFVPTLEAATAFFLIAAPLAMIALLLTRSQRFPRIFVMLSVCQAGLVLAGLLGADAFSRLATEAIAVMTTTEDVEVHRAVEELRRAQGVLERTAAAFVVPMLGHLAWLPFLLSSRRAGAFFTAGRPSTPSD